MRKGANANTTVILISIPAVREKVEKGNECKE